MVAKFEVAEVVRPRKSPGLSDAQSRTARCDSAAGFLERHLPVRSAVTPRIARIVLACALTGCSAIDSNTDILQLEDQRDAKWAAQLTQEGVHQLRRGHTQKAQAAFQRAVAADETYGPAHNNLGLLLFDERDLYSAAWSFQRAIEFMPQRGEPSNNLGLTYEAAGRLDEAIAMYYTAHELEPVNFEYLGNLTRARTRRGDRDNLLRHELQQLLFIDTRPEWIAWAEDQLVLSLGKQQAEFDPRLDMDEDPEATESLPTPMSTRRSTSDDRASEPPIESQYPALIAPDGQ